MFHIPITFLFTHFSKAEIKFPYVGIFLELFHGIIQDDSTIFHHISATCDGEGQPGVLFH